MKKIALLLGLSILISLSSYSQSNKRTSAYMYLQNMELDKAKTAIDEASIHVKTKEDPKTWLYKGEIYYQIAVSPLPVFSDLDKNAPTVAYEALLNAKKYDLKGKYEDEIAQYLGYLTSAFYASGGQSFQDGDYASAINDFEIAFNIAKENGVFDTIAAFNIGMAGVLSDDPAIATEYLAKCIEVQFDDPRVYTFYNRSAKQLGDTVRALEIIKQGRERYPEELTLLLEEAQLYLEQGKKEELLASLLLAIEADPENSNLYFLVGKTYDDKKEYVVAEEYYKKAAEYKPDFFEAYYNIGAIYVNQAAEVQGEANDLPLNETEKYDELTAIASKHLEAAVPYLEKALEVRPDDVPTITALKEAYARLKMDDKLEQMNNK